MTGLSISQRKRSTQEKGARIMRRLRPVAICLIAVAFVTACATAPAPRAPLDASERWRFSFDSRQWQVGHQHADRDQAIREYVLSGQTVQNWSELVTSHYFARNVAPRTIFEWFQSDISRGCPSVRISVIDESADTILFEWQHDGCRGFSAQHEIRRVSKGRTGVLALSFAEKTRQLAPDKRNTWLTIIRGATIRPDA